MINLRKIDLRTLTEYNVYTDEAKSEVYLVISIHFFKKKIDV